MKIQTAWLLIALIAALSFVAVGANAPRAPFHTLLAQVGIVVGVAPNPYNSLDAQLNQKQDQLNQQAADLAAQQAAFASSTAAANDAMAPTVWYLSIAIAIIALLLILNFYFDWRRMRREKKIGSVAVSDDIESPTLSVGPPGH